MPSLAAFLAENLSQSASRPLSRAITDVLKERARQINVEGFTPEHDDLHIGGELARAGACYAMHAAMRESVRDALKGLGAPSKWPWDKAWWKPSDRRRELVKAAALLLAEIERIDRK